MRCMKSNSITWKCFDTINNWSDPHISTSAQFYFSIYKYSIQKAQTTAAPKPNIAAPVIAEPCAAW